jgi:hypothetical protein
MNIVTPIASASRNLVDAEEGILNDKSKIRRVARRDPPDEAGLLQFDG